MNKTKIFSNLFALIASLVMVTNPVLAQLTPVQQQSVPITNLVPNSGFESGTAQWTKTGGSWSVVTSGPNLGIGTTSVCWTPSAAGQKLRSTAFNIPGILKNQGGIASISAKIPSGLGTYKFNITDGSGVVLDSKPIKQTGSEWTTNDNFSFLYNQAVSGKVQFEVEAVAASEPMICLDDSFIGKAYNVKQAETKAVGEVFAVATPTCPAGSLIADGGAIQRAFYADLFQAIGVTHGQGDGSTTFNKPDYRGRFLRGVTGASANDPDAASRTAMATGGNTGNNVGSVQGHAFQTHTHTQAPHRHNLPARGDENNGDKVSATGGAQDNYSVYSDYQTPTINSAAASGTNAQATANETRPVNAYVTYCVQYQPPVQVYDVGQVVDSTGTSITYNGAVCPAGTLDENGASVLRANYPKLFNKIGTAWGNGSTNPSGVSADVGCPHATNCFNIPDKRGRFNRTVANGSANDPDRAARTASATGGNVGDNVGSVQGQATAKNGLYDQGHFHPIYAKTSNGVAGADSRIPTLASGGADISTQLGYASIASADSETRPVNAYVKSCIIYDGTIYTPVFAGAVTSKSGVASGVVTVINTPKSISADYNVTANEDVIYVDTSGGVRNVNLPNAAQFPGKRYEILVSSDSNYANVNATNSQTVCGLASVKVVGKADSLRVQSIGGNWVGVEGTCYREVFGFVYGSGTNSACSASPCLLTRSQGVSNVTRYSAGIYGINLSPAFSDNPIFCHTSMNSYTSSASVLAFNVRCQVGSPSSITVDFGSGSTTGMDSSFTFLVKGLR